MSSIRPTRRGMKRTIPSKPLSTRLAFAARLASINLGTLAERPFERLARDLNEQFLGGPGPINAHLGPYASRDEMRKLQALAQRLLRTAAHGRDFGPDRSAVVVELNVKLNFIVLPSEPSDARGSRELGVVSLGGSLRDRFFALLCFELARSPHGRIRACRSCERVFVRTTRDIYCSARCRWRANKRSQRLSRAQPTRIRKGSVKASGRRRKQ